MPLLRSNTADKIIVDRRKPHRNSEVARAVRKTRDQLANQPGNLSFDRELLKLHARSMANVAVAIPVMVLAIAAAGL
jgi:two-component system cell cycle sensor histidine kinase PleC